MNRRAFLVRSSLFASAGLLVRSSLSAQAPAKSAAPAPAAGSGQAATRAAAAPTVTEFKALRRDVGIFTGRGGSIGWLASKDALVAVDTQFPDTAATFAMGVPGRGGRVFDVVINTHHHGDHTGGNPVLKPIAKSIVAHANVPKLQFAAAEKANTVDKQVYADTTFPEVWRREIGSEVVGAQYHGAAHTSGDVIVLFEKANVVHMGDLMFNRLYPVIDRISGGRIKGWISVLEEAAKTYPADAIYIFGHGNAKFGPTGTRGDLLVFRDYLSGLLDYTSKKIAAGEAKEKIMALENLPGFDDFHLPLPNRLSANLAVAYDELTDKKS
jgi:cyclase